MAQTELHPITPGCRHFRGRFKLQPSRKSPFPEQVFQRYECEQGHENNDAESAYKCGITMSGCWKDSEQEWVTREGMPRELPKEA